MAEWSGQKRTLNSIPVADDPPLDDTSVHVPDAPPAPGATSSPQLPGMTPDEPNLPGKERGTLQPLASVRRPLSEYGTAQHLLRLFTPEPGTELEAADWEQAPAAREELRKADPALVTPIRPLSGYGLGVGRTARAIASEALAALGDPGEVVTAAPGAPEPTAEPAAERPEIPAATAAPAVPAGAVPGNGTADCPDGYPVKGNARSMIYHAPESRVYAQTIAEVCFATADAAQAAGYHAPKHL